MSNFLLAIFDEVFYINWNVLMSWAQIKRYFTDKLCQLMDIESLSTWPNWDNWFAIHFGTMTHNLKTIPAEKSFQNKLRHAFWSFCYFFHVLKLARWWFLKTSQKFFGFKFFYSIMLQKQTQHSGLSDTSSLVFFKKKLNKTACNKAKTWRLRLSFNLYGVVFALKKDIFFLIFWGLFFKTHLLARYVMCKTI